MKYIYKYLLLVVILGFIYSCDITNIDDIEPQFKISEKNAFENSTLIDAALTGIYNRTLFDYATVLQNSANTGHMGITLTSRYGFKGYRDNSLTSETVSSSSYSAPYEAINAINFFIEGVSNAGNEIISAEEKNHMLGEARFLRADQYFLLLRNFGQFWDKGSKYGVVVHTEPNREVINKSRSSVQEVYNLIIEDLDYAISNAPNFSTAIYASKEAAIAFKAKVLMHSGDYSGAIPLLEQIMNSGTFILEPNYADVFINTYNSSESILVNYWDSEHNSFRRFKSLFYFYGVWSASSTYDALMPLSDPRRAVVLKSVPPNRPINILKYENDSAASFFMRLAEVYLMHAECVARSGGGLSTAQASLDYVRARVGLPSTEAANNGELLEHIRIEKLLELAFENGEHWFDMIRYHVNGDVNITDLKASITSETQFIQPIPFLSIENSDGFVEQNPGY